MQTTAADGYYAAEPFFVTFPATVTAADGTASWDYDIDAYVKMEFTPIPEEENPPEEEEE